MLAWLERTIPHVMNLLDPGFHSPPITYLVMIYILYSIAIIYGVLLVRDKMVVLVDYQTMGNKHRDCSVVDDVSSTGNQQSSIYLEWDDVETSLRQPSIDGRPRVLMETNKGNDSNDINHGGNTNLEMRPSRIRTVGGGDDHNFTKSPMVEG